MMDVIPSMYIVRPHYSDN